MPYFEREFSGRERKLEVGDIVRIGPGPRKSEVEIWGENLALVTPTRFRDVHFGNYDANGNLKCQPQDVLTERTVVERVSLSTNSRRPFIIWKPK